MIKRKLPRSVSLTQLLSLHDIEQELSAYLDYTVEITVLLGGDRNASRRDMIEMIEFEQSLAQYVMTVEESRDESLHYRNITLKELKVNQVEKKYFDNRMLCVCVRYAVF